MLCLCEPVTSADHWQGSSSQQMLAPLGGYGAGPSPVGQPVLAVTAAEHRRPQGGTGGAEGGEQQTGGGISAGQKQQHQHHHQPSSPGSSIGGGSSFVSGELGGSPVRSTPPAGADMATGRGRGRGGAVPLSAWQHDIAVGHEHSLLFVAPLSFALPVSHSGHKKQHSFGGPGGGGSRTSSFGPEQRHAGTAQWVFDRANSADSGVWVGLK